MPNRKSREVTRVEKNEKENEFIRMQMSKFNFGEFDRTKVTWVNYLSQFKRACLVKGLGGDGPTWKSARRDLLLAYVGAEPLREIENYFLPNDVDDSSWEEVLSACNKLFKPNITLFAARIEFERSFRREEEKCQEFASKLRELSRACNYGPNWDERLRDRFVAGAKFLNFEIEVRQRWPEGKKENGDQVTFTEMVELAVSMERAKEEVKANPFDDTENLVRRMDRSKPSNNQRCPTCGILTTHGPKGCPASEAVCRSCATKGHYWRVCSKRRNFRRPVRLLNEQVESDNDESHIGRMESINTITNRGFLKMEKKFG